MSHSHTRKEIIRSVQKRVKEEKKNGKVISRLTTFVISTIFHKVQLLCERARLGKKFLVDTSQTLCIRTILYIPMHLLCISILQTVHRKCIVFMQFRLNPTLFLSLLSRLRTHSFLIHEILNCFKPKTEIIDIYESKMTITVNKLLLSGRFSRI